MNTRNIVDMRKRPPHRSDVLANAVFGDQIPELFRPGKYYERGNIVYTFDGEGDITVWECQKSGMYNRPARPSWVEWSMEDVRKRLKDLEDFIGTQADTYDTKSYDMSYYIHDVGVKDWECRGSYIEAYNNNKYLPRKKYMITDNELVPAEGVEELPDEKNTVLYLNRAVNKITNLIRRVEMYASPNEDGKIPIPFPMDMRIFSSYIFDLYIDGVYISQNCITIKRGEGEDSTKYATVDFNTIEISDDNRYRIEDGDLEVKPPLTNITEESECVFIFYISICHDLILSKVDFDKFIGEDRESRWLDTSILDYEECYQEVSVFDNGIRLRETQFSISNNRVNIDMPENRFSIGGIATVSMKVFTAMEQDVVPNVKQETIPMMNGNSKVIPIPFLNYSEGEDHFLVFNDGGILLGNQRWFEDNGYINFYDGDPNLDDNDMLEFRMISRDQNMEVRVYTIETIMDEQRTYELPIRLRDVYFHMLFSENGEFVSRTKYAISGTILQFREKYATMAKGDRFELICFCYIGDYGFTAMTNYRSNWNPDYVEIVENTLPIYNPEDDGTEEPVDPDDRDDEGNDDEWEPSLDYTPIVNPYGTTLKYDPPDPPGTEYQLVQDVATIRLKSTITKSDVSLVIGVDADNQIICTTYNGDILRYSREGEEDLRYKLKEVSNNSIDMLDCDDFGNSYFHTYATLKIGKVDRKGNKLWEFKPEDFTDPVSYIRSIEYIDNYLYVEYAPYAITEYTMGRIDAMTGKFAPIPISMPDEDGINTIQQWSAKISHLNNDHIYIGSNGHVVYEFEKSGLFVKKYTDLVEDFNSGNVIDVYCDGVDGNVYAISRSPQTLSCQLIKYNNVGGLEYVKQYYGEIQMTFDPDGYLYLYDEAEMTISKMDRETGEYIWRYLFTDGISNLNGFFVDPIDYHVYGYYVNNNAYDKYRYVELEQNHLPLPKYRHEIVFNSDENVTSTDLLGSSVREINLLPAPTNRLYIGTIDGSIYTFTQSMREMSKKRSVKLWDDENLDNPKYIIPDNEYNFIVIKDNVIEKWNRYERVKWRFDGNGIMRNVLRQIVLNPITKDLVFLYADTDGNHCLGKISIDGEFEPLQVTLPNGVRVEDADCAMCCTAAGDYFFGYTGKTLYRYSKNFNFLMSYGIDTNEKLDGPVGSIVCDEDVHYIYVTVKDLDDDNPNDKLIRYNQSGNIVWEHDFMYNTTNGTVLMDVDGYVYVCDDKEIRKIDKYGNFIWRFKYKYENVNFGEPLYLVIDEFYRIFFVDKQHNLHRIDQYDLTLDPVPDEEPEPEEPKDPVDPDKPDIPVNMIEIQKRFDIPFEYDRTTSAIMIFTNTGQYVGKRFYDIYDDQIVLKGTPIYKNGWLDIILVENVKESIVLTGGVTL